MRPVRKADNLTAIPCRCHEIWETYLPGTLWALQARNGTALPFRTCFVVRRTEKIILKI